MREFLSQKQKLTFLVFLFAFGLAGLGAFLAVMAIRHDSLSERTVFEWLLPEELLSIMILATLTFYSYSGVNKGISGLINETMDTLANGIIYFDSKGKMTRFNPAAAIMLPELSIQEGDASFIGTYKKFLAFVYDHSLDIQDQSRLTNTMHQGDDSTSRLLFREVIELLNHKVIMIQFYQRRSSEIIAIMTDISIMKRHIDEVAALTEENMIMIKAIEAAGSGMVIAQSDGAGAEIIFSNQVFADMMGVNLNTIHNASLHEVLESAFEDQIDTIRAAIQTVRKEGSVQNVWLKKRYERKEVLWYALYILFFADTNDKEYFVCFVSNQTQARISQAHSYQSQKLEAIAQLAGGIAHDFNNILSVVDGYAKLAQRGLEKGNDITNFLDQIHKGVKRGSEITGRLLTFGQCRVTQKIRLDICEQVRDLEAFLSPSMDSSINLILSIQDNPCYVDSSPDAITQIVMSLVSNAREAMPNGGDLIISVAEASRSQLLAVSQTVDPQTNYVCVQVIDSGIGIDPEILPRIYEPFFTSKDPAKNPGLGLSLVYGLVKEIEAIIDVKSTVGVGTSVSIVIPLQSAPQQQVFNEPIKKPVPVKELEGKTILVVEDSADVLEMQCRFLEDAGMNVIQAASAAEAFGKQEKHTGEIDFLLSDVIMPGMNGVEFSEAFSLKRPDTKIILISAYPALASVGDGRSVTTVFSENQIILAKPLVYERLAEVLIAHIESKKSKPDMEDAARWSHHKKIL